jgi:hypothetical protein
MRKLALLSVAFALFAVSFYGCAGELPVAPELADGGPTPLFTSPPPISAPAGIEEVAEDEWTCWAYGYGAERVRVRWESGNAHAVCHFKGLPRIPRVNRLSGFPCVRYTLYGYNYSYDSRYIRTPGGSAKLSCRI